jgi:hypothetical protein
MSKTKLFETHHQEYENFVQLLREIVDLMFLRFEPIVNNMCANKPWLPFDDHERDLKLLHALDRRVWDIKVVVITKYPNYETLTVDELLNKAQVHRDRPAIQSQN